MSSTISKSFYLAPWSAQTFPFTPKDAGRIVLEFRSCPHYPRLLLNDARDRLILSETGGISEKSIKRVIHAEPGVYELRMFNETPQDMALTVTVGYESSMEVEEEVAPVDENDSEDIFVKTELYKHQQELVEKAADKTYYAILHQPGLGKTLSALWIIVFRLLKYPAYKTLVVVPNTLVENWMEEVEKHTNLVAVPVVGTRQKRSIILQVQAHLYIINYEGLRIMQDELVAANFDLVVFDESHNLKNPDSQQSKAGYKVAMACPHRIIMTGTPIMNTPLDVFAQYRCLSPDIFGVSYNAFRSRYAVMGGYLGKVVIKYINLETLKNKTLACADYRTKEECLDLPPKLFETIRVDLIPQQVEMYRQLRDQFIAMCKEDVVTAPVLLTRLMRFSQITAGFYKTTDGREVSYGRNPKQEWLVEWLLETGQKTVVFVRFIKELKDLEAALEKAGIDFVSVYGEVKDRMALIKRFNNEESLQVFIAQIDTAGQGINLHAASYCVFLSNNYSYGDREQAESRIHRFGQKAKSCTFIDVIARGTIDERVLKILRRKESLAGMLAKDLIKIL